MYNQLEPNEPARAEEHVAALINDYLERVTAPLVEVSAYEDREALRVELRQHIEDIATAHRELGSDPAEAMRAAIKQFGEPQRIGSEIARQKHRSDLRSLGTQLGSRLFRIVPPGIAGALLYRIADLSFVRSGLVSYDSGWFLCFVGFGVGVVTKSVTRNRESLLHSSLRGMLVSMGTIGALVMVAAILAGRYPLTLFAAGLLRFGLAGAITGLVSAILEHLWPRNNIPVRATKVA